MRDCVVLHVMGTYYIPGMASAAPPTFLPRKSPPRHEFAFGPQPPDIAPVEGATIRVVHRHAISTPVDPVAKLDTPADLWNSLAQITLAIDAPCAVLDIAKRFDGGMRHARAKLLEMGL